MPMPPSTAARAHRLLLACFFFSGFAALLYQTVWMRLALAAFGVNTPVVATVLTVFMLGLATGTHLAGRVVERLESQDPAAGLRLYGLAELGIGTGGVLVPSLLRGGRTALLALGPADSLIYTLSSAVLLTAILLPFCTAMGLTFPAAISFLRRASVGHSGQQPFSALYLANVAGALFGAVVTPLLLVELLGFRHTGLVAVAANGAIGIVALFAARKLVLAPALGQARSVATPPVAGAFGRRAALFVTGFSTMGLEVVWSRMYPTLIGTFVYSFAAILAIYLLATTVGSAVYRRLRHHGTTIQPGVWWPWLFVAAILPLVTASVGFPPIVPLLRVALGLFPFCALLGFLTPALVDLEAGDDPRRVANAYGLNLLGSLAGPLVAGFGLLPWIGTRGASLLLAAPILALVLVPTFRRQTAAWPAWAACALSFALLARTTLFEEQFSPTQVRQDHVATVVADGAGLQKRLFVNGIGMTSLTSITKMMAHFPAAHLAATDQPLSALVICFGMGTSFRSLASWHAQTTAVELVPSVTELYGYYYPEGPALVRSSGGALTIEHDDGRRFLDRTKRTFDLVVIDPPPPVEAAGSSLLYSREFYTSARRRMRPGAILATWLPGGDRQTLAGVTLALEASFAQVRMFGSIEGWGVHFLASDRPIPRLSAEQLVARMPASAVADMREWIAAPPTRFFEGMLSREYSPAPGRSQGELAITDDRPLNEFFFARRALSGAGVPLRVLLDARAWN